MEAEGIVYNATTREVVAFHSAGLNWVVFGFDCTNGSINYVCGGY